MITALCNIYIGNDEKLALFIETFPLVYGISDNWLVYIRGGNSQKVINYIKKNFSDYHNKITFFDNLYDNNWAKSTREMLKKSKYDYIYNFFEDHFLIKPINHHRSVVKDMEKNTIDFFQYSFFNIGFSKNSIEHMYPEESKYFYQFNLKKEHLPILQKTNKSFYPYSLTGISSKKFFNRLLNIEKKHLIKVPFLIHAIMENIFFFYPKDRAFWFKVNKLVKYIGLRFVIYPPASPFNLEKSLFDCDNELLPFKIGVLKEELFANWDDDNKLSNSSLIKRGLYPKYFRTDRGEKLELSNCKRYTLLKGQKSNHQYLPDKGRITNLPMKYIYVKKGVLKISSKKESFILNPGQSAWVVASIPHTITAKGDSSFCSYIDTN